MRTISMVVMLTIIALFFGCGTVTKSSDYKFGENHKTVFVSDRYTGDEADYVGDIMVVLEKYGFVITDDRKNADYQLDFSITGGANLVVKIALLKDYKPVIDVTSGNAGWGTIVARRGAIGGRVSAALKEFEEALVKAM